jgi:hypothetical protein
LPHQLPRGRWATCLLLMTGLFCSSLSQRSLGGCFLLAVLLLWNVLPAAAQDSTLTRLIRQNRCPLAAAGAQFSGPGWDKLQAAVQKSQFVLLGEDHGTAEIPVFTAAIARELKPALFVAEIDPYVAQEITRLVAQPGPPTAYLRQYPGALCFYSLAEEFELMRTLRAQQTQLLGIDQVWSLSAAPFYTRLAGQVKSKATQTYLKQRAAAYQAQDQANERQGGHTYAMTAQGASAIDSLLAITKKEGPAVQKMVQDYATSYRIYQAQIHGTGGHQERLNLMKRNLLQEVRPYETVGNQNIPKALFKFGGAHSARGLSPIRGGDFYDVGNFAQNLAEAQGQQSLHILIMGKQGSRATSLNPRFPDKIARPYTEADADAEVEKPFLAQTSGPAWSVFDLRPLRAAISKGKLQVPNQTLQRTIMGYDYLVVMPETTASHPL